MLKVVCRQYQYYKLLLCQEQKYAKGKGDQSHSSSHRGKVGIPNFFFRTLQLAMCSAEQYYFWDQKGATSNCKTRFFSKNYSKINSIFDIRQTINVTYCLNTTVCLNQMFYQGIPTKILANQLLIDCVIILKVDTIYQSPLDP